MVKVLHLLVLAFSWGMQVWVSFIAGFALVRVVTLHTFGLVQSKLFPVYFCSLFCGNTLNMVVYAAYHPRELLDWHESVQMILFFVAPIMSGLNSQWFAPATTEAMLQLREIEEEHGLGQQVGLGRQKEAYAKLKEQDPKYRAFKSTFGRYHGISNLCNLIGFLCTTTNLVYTALHLNTI